MNARERVLTYFHKRWPIDWRLLAFLLLFLDVKLAVKVVAIVLIYLLQPQFRFGFRLRNSRLPLFYPAMILIAFIDLVIYKRFADTAYLVSFITGTCFWLACILAIHQLKLFTEKLHAETIISTLVVFFIINALFSYGEYFRIVVETGSINPYRYQGDHQKYFINTGDYIKGASFDISVTNAILNAVGVIFFLFKRRMGMVMLCMSVVLLTVSNLTNILLLAVLLYIFIANSDRDQKSVIMACLFLLVIFLAKISPQNNTYLTEIYAKITGTQKRSKPMEKVIPIRDRPDGLLSGYERKQKIAILYLDSVNKEREQKRKIQFASFTLATNSADRPIVPQANIHSEPYQNRDEVGPARKRLLDYMRMQGIDEMETGKLAGKLIAARQTWSFLRSHPERIMTGNGIGTFSSKLAFKTAALGVGGGYPEQFRFIDPAFYENHLLVYLTFFSRPPKMHSVLNSPDSAYLQLAGEYGIAGLLAFAIGYLGYFMKGLSLKGYGIPVLLMLAGILFTDYWFEQLSVLIIFELIMLLNLKETRVTNE